VIDGSIAEEEYCYIPMGGALPDPMQRIIPVGGAANTVHPATGYQLCRLLASSSILAGAVTEQLRKGDTFTPDTAAAAAHAALWPRRLRLQRDFQVFGGEFLLRQPVHNLRGFFDAFFKLEQQQWSGFLAGWTTLPGNERHEEWDRRLRFGLAIFVRFPPQVGASFSYLYSTLPLCIPQTHPHTQLNPTLSLP
jgi:lycopene beta-cyclase